MAPSARVPRGCASPEARLPQAWCLPEAARTPRGLGVCAARRGFSPALLAPTCRRCAFIALSHLAPPSRRSGHLSRSAAVATTAPWAPLPSRVATRHRSRASQPIPSLASPGADPVAPCLCQVPVSPEPGTQRRPLAAAVESTRRHGRPPKSGANQPLVPRRTSPSPSPAKSGGVLARISPEPRRQRPYGPHCKAAKLSEGFSAKGELQ
jgi:hypothetical protein